MFRLSINICRKANVVRSSTSSMARSTMRQYASRQAFYDRIHTQLEEIDNSGLFKHERIILSQQSSEIQVNNLKGERTNVLNFCANNYLGLSNNADLIEASKKTLDSHGLGLSSVRFICGTQDIHKQLEKRISAFHGKEDAILYAAAFDANGGLFEPLFGAEDAVISDELNHASIIDGMRLCKATKKRYKHLDLDDLRAQLESVKEARSKLVVTDGVFSMDGDIAPLKEICSIADEYDALVAIDDCHATGFVGATGRGTAEHCGVLERVDIIVSTLGKALGGASGGFTTASADVISLLRQHSRPYLFSNTVAPSIVGATIKVFDMLESSTALRDTLEANMRHFRTRMQEEGFEIRGANHAICPVMIYDARLAAQFATKMLNEHGIYVVAFSFPVVPHETARIRVQLSAAHTKEQIDRTVDAFVTVASGLYMGDDPLLSAAQQQKHVSTGDEFRCIHDEMAAKYNSAYLTVPQEYNDGRKRQMGSNLRITLDLSLLDNGADVDSTSGQSLVCYESTDSFLTAENYQQACQEEDRLTAAKLAWIVDKLLAEAVSRLEAALFVDPVEGGLQVADSTCHRVEIAKGSFNDTDMLVYVTARPILQAGVLAHADACQFDQKGRPIAGTINYSPHALSVDSKVKSQMGTTLHEFAHTLGMRGARFGTFVGMTQADVVKEVANVAGKTVQMIVTPNVRAFVREHFDCAVLEGAELESDGGSGTAGSHWEKRVFFNEFMTGSSSSNPVLSPLTLALFEDSGWYSGVNYSVADPLVFGRGLGCNFVKERCGPTASAPTDRGWPQKDAYPGYYCTTDGAQSCSFDLYSKARCVIIQHEPLDQEYQYTDVATGKGGLSRLADFCPMYWPMPDDCRDESTGGCADCRCFESDSLPLQCHWMRCFDASTIRVRINGVYYKCPDDADAMGNLSPLGHGSIVKCPLPMVLSAVCANVTYDTVDYPSLTSITANPSTGTGTGSMNNNMMQSTDPTSPSSQTTINIPNSVDVLHFSIPLIFLLCFVFTQ